MGHKAKYNFSIIHLGAIALLSVGLAACNDNKGRAPEQGNPAIVADVPSAPQVNQCLQQYPYQSYEQMTHEQRRAWRRHQRSRFLPYRWKRVKVVDYGVHGPKKGAKAWQEEDEYVEHQGEDEVRDQRAEDDFHSHQGEDEIYGHEGEDEGVPSYKGGRFQNPPPGYHRPQPPYTPNYPHQPIPHQPVPAQQQGFCGCDVGYVPVCDANVGMTCVLTQQLQGYEVAWWNMNDQNGFAWGGYVNPRYGRQRLQVRKSCWSHVAQTCQPGTVPVQGTAFCQPIRGGQIGIWVQRPGVR